MGLFDKLKSITGKLLGNSAKVELITDVTVERGKRFKVLVIAVVKEQDIHIERVYLHVQSVERLIITKTVQEGNNTRIRDEEKKNILNDVYFDITGAQTLEANKTYQWEKEIVLPEHVQPTYNAHPRTHSWQVVAGLDTKGNDPDSGWKDLFVN